jgi:hypothetical protein
MFVQKVKTSNAVLVPANVLHLVKSEQVFSFSKETQELRFEKAAQTLRGKM